MTQKQEKYLTEKYIRPMVRRLLRENKIKIDSGSNTPIYLSKRSSWIELEQKDIDTGGLNSIAIARDQIQQIIKELQIF